MKAEHHNPIFDLNSLELAYARIVPEEEYYCMRSLLKPEGLATLSNLKDKNILINCHLTVATLILVDAFVKTGANVIVTRAQELVCHTEVYEQLCAQELFIPFHHLEQTCYQSFFDIVCDCGGYLANILKPSIAFIELTHVERKRYYNATSPIVSVDESIVKCIETSLGTGDGFVRAIKKTLAQRQDNYLNKKYMVFGNGKVGRGIVHCLVESGVRKSQIIIIDVQDKAVNQAKLHGFEAYNLVSQYPDIKKLIPKVNVAVSATGISGTLSRYFTDEDFQAVAYLANMGTYDEWGQQFCDSRVLHHKKPLNFMLEFPTRVCFLDPIFSLMVQASSDAVDTHHGNPFKVHQPPITIQENVLKQWMREGPIDYKWNDIKKVTGESLEALNIA